jgi:hypothetical protein
MEHAFPGANKGSSALKLPVIDLKVSSEYSPSDAEQFHDTYHVLRNKVYMLVGRDHEFTRRAGAEACILECQMLVESPELKRTKDALVEAKLGSTGVKISNDSMDRIQRLERLVSEAESRLQAVRFVPAHYGSMLGDVVLPQAPATAAPAHDSTTTMLLIVVGGAIVFGMGILVAATLFSGRK